MHDGVSSQRSAQIKHLACSALVRAHFPHLPHAFQLVEKLSTQVRVPVVSATPAQVIYGRQLIIEGRHFPPKNGRQSFCHLSCSGFNRHIECLGKSCSSRRRGGGSNSLVVEEEVAGEKEEEVMVVEDEVVVAGEEKDEEQEVGAVAEDAVLAARPD